VVICFPHLFRSWLLFKVALPQHRACVCRLFLWVFGRRKLKLPLELWSLRHFLRLSGVSWSGKVGFERLHVDDSLNKVFLWNLRDNSFEISDEVLVIIWVGLYLLERSNNELLPFLHKQVFTMVLMVLNLWFSAFRASCLRMCCLSI
jgi:hypothetical protein